MSFESLSNLWGDQYTEVCPGAATFCPGGPTAHLVASSSPSTESSAFCESSLAAAIDPRFIPRKSRRELIPAPPRLWGGRGKGEDQVIKVFLVSHYIHTTGASSLRGIMIKGSSVIIACIIIKV